MTAPLEDLMRRVFPEDDDPRCWGACEGDDCHWCDAGLVYGPGMRTSTTTHEHDCLWVRVMLALWDHLPDEHRVGDGPTVDVSEVTVDGETYRAGDGSPVGTYLGLMIEAGAEKE